MNSGCRIVAHTSDVTRRAVRACAAIGLACAIAGCGSDQQILVASAEPPEPASVRLFINNFDFTTHIPPTSGADTELEIRLYAVNGARIAGYDDHFEVTLEFLPATLASTTPVANRPLVKMVRPTAPAGELGSLRVSVGHLHTMTSRTFGPFEVLIH
jgi:hypothetical protein